MKYGYVKTCVASPSLRVADCAYNAQNIINCLRDAHSAGVHMLVFPELSLTGVTCGDLFFHSALLAAAKDALRSVLWESRGKKMLVFVGAPLAFSHTLYNCAIALCDGQILGVVPKENPTEDGRWFASGVGVAGEMELLGQSAPFGSDLLFTCPDLPELKAACEIGQDAAALFAPANRHAAAGATFIAHLDGSSELVGRADVRRQTAMAQSRRLACAYASAGAGVGESTGDAVYAGHGLIAENGALLAENKPFGEGIAVTDIDVLLLAGLRRKQPNFPQDGSEYRTANFPLEMGQTPLSRRFSKTPFAPEDAQACTERCAQIFAIQSEGLKKRVAHIHAKTLVLGVSGGLDSTLALLVMVEAMDALARDRKDIIAVTMPCFGTTKRTKSNAQRLCEEFGVTFREVNITQSVLKHFADIGHDGQTPDVTYENAQARERTQVLMDIANQTGGIVVGTGDLSELALGWATYNGDHMSMYGVNASIPKTLVRHIVFWYAQNRAQDVLAQTLLDVLDTPVSPELLPAKDGDISQKTEDLVGPYELHDFFLYYFVRHGFAPDKIYHIAKAAFAGAYEDETIKKWLATFVRRFFAQQFKRACLPEGPAVGTVSLSPRGAWQMPSDAVGTLWQNTLKD